MTLDAFLLGWCLANLLAFLTFGFDKFSARQGKYRIPEKRLLILTLLGGLGALAASSLFRHKTRKQPFRSRALALGAVHLVLTAAALVGLN